MKISREAFLPLLNLIKEHPNEFVSHLIWSTCEPGANGEAEVYLGRNPDARGVLDRLAKEVAPEGSEEASKLMAVCQVVYERRGRADGCVLTFSDSMTKEEYMQVDALYEAMQRAGYITPPAPNAIG